MTTRSYLAVAAVLVAAVPAIADPAPQDYAAVDKLVKDSKVIDLLAGVKGGAQSVRFLVIATPKRFGPSLLLSESGVLWISLPALNSRMMLSPGDLLRYNLSLDVVRQGIDDARKRPEVFVDSRRKNDMPAGAGAPYLLPFSWRTMAALAASKEKPVVAGREGTYDLGICRGIHANGKHPGKLIGDKCYYGFGGKEVVTTEFDVLVPGGERLAWQTVALAEVARKDIPAGYEPSHNLPVCRAAHQGATHPGKVVGKGCHIGFAGSEIEVTTFEVLVRSN